MPDLAHLLPMLAFLMAVGAFAGVIAGLLGVGGGIILVPAFFYVFTVLGYGSDELMRICLATSLATIIVTSLRSLASHNRKGAVDWPIFREITPWILVGQKTIPFDEELNPESLTLAFWIKPQALSTQRTVGISSRSGGFCCQCW